MSFTSTTFIVFIVIMLLGYYIIPKKFQWILLLVGSYVFYLWFTPYFIFFLLFSTMTTWLFPILIGKINENQEAFLRSDEARMLPKKGMGGVMEYRKHNGRKKRVLLVVCLICNIGILVVLKYTNFLINTVNVFGVNLASIDWIVLPIGISFYTFQSVGYCIDVYRETVEPQRNFFKYALYVSFFPQICQGPIGRYNDLAPQLYKKHKFDYDVFVMGLERMLLGFFKKLVVANRIGLYVDIIFDNPSGYSGGILALATVMYAFQLYADFSGYMDIALGIGASLGIRLEENFRQPYFSQSITEFWRRWHITLGSWFRDYLYYSILRSGWCSTIGKKLSKSGHKKLSKVLTAVIGLIITWFLIGLWHGASWNFVFYGLYHGMFVILAIILADVYTKSKKAVNVKENGKPWKVFQILRTFAIVCFGYILFRANTLVDAGIIFQKLFTDLIPKFGVGYFSGLFLDNFNKTTWLMTVMFIILCFIIEVKSQKKDICQWFYGKRTLLKLIMLYCITMAIIVFGRFGTSSFLYFQF